MSTDATSGVVRGVADLPADTLLDAAALARMFGKCKKSVFRAVDRKELPAPSMMFGKRVWTAGAVRDHLARRQAQAIRDAERQETRRAADFS